MTTALPAPDDAGSSIDPAGRADRDQVVVLSGHSREGPKRVLRNLTADAGAYNYRKRALIDFFRD